MASKEERHFSKLIGIWTKLRRAKGTLVIAGESPVAVFSSCEVSDCSHARSLRSALVLCLFFKGGVQLPNVNAKCDPHFTRAIWDWKKLLVTERASVAT